MSKSKSTNTVDLKGKKSCQDVVLERICKTMQKVRDIPKSLCDELIITDECLVGTEKPYLTEDNIRHIANCGKTKSMHRIDVLYDNPQEHFGMKLLSYHPQDTYKLLKALEKEGIEYATTDPKITPTTIIMNDLRPYLLQARARAPHIQNCLTLQYLDEEEPRIDEVVKKNF